MSCADVFLSQKWKNQGRNIYIVDLASNDKHVLNVDSTMT